MLDEKKPLVGDFRSRDHYIAWLTKEIEQLCDEAEEGSEKF